ncbi:MAG: hypothetical protein QXF56_00045 [Candidatus Micrarchaeia archaeon]
MGEAVKAWEKRALSKPDVWKEMLHPYFLSEDRETTEKTVGELRRVSSILENRFGDDFIGMSLAGSRAKGYARASREKRGSDFDVLVFFKKAEREKVEEFNEIMLKNLESRVLMELEIHGFELSKTIRDLRAGRVNEKEIAAYFMGEPISGERKLADARWEIIREISKNPEAKAVWDRVVSWHVESEVMLPKNPEKVGLTEKEIEEINRERVRRLSLPSWDAVKEQLKRL